MWLISLIKYLKKEGHTFADFDSINTKLQQKMTNEQKTN